MYRLFSNYEAKLSGQMVKSLGKSIIKMYSMGACAGLGMTKQDVLSEDLESDPLLNSALQMFTCEHYYSCLAPLSVGLITGRHYLSEHGIKNGETSGDNRSKCAGIRAAMTAELLIGFWLVLELY